MIKISCEKDPGKAKALWEEISPNESLYDRWDFRFAFWQTKPWPLSFYAAHDEGRLVALLPLQENTEAGYLEFLAADFMESNRIFCRPGYEGLAFDLVKATKQSLRLYDLVFETPPPTPWEIEDYTYYAELRYKSKP